MIVDELKIEEEQEEEATSITYDIASYPSDFTLWGISEMYKQGDIVIPDYQREFVWSMRQSSLLIDSFLCGLPVPSVFFYIDEKNKNLVIDGQQRILSVFFFFDGYFGKESQGKRQIFRLTGLDARSPYHNKRFEDLDETDQRKLRQAVLRAVNIRQLSPVGESTSAYHIFERLNTGGTPLKPQEIRNCVFRGELNKKLREANKDKNWRKILGKKYSDKHQRDVELLLRIFSLSEAELDYEKPMKEFLNRSMVRNNSGATKKAESFFETFPIVTQAVVSALGESPFHFRGPLNVSALDSVMSVLVEDYKQIELTNLKENFNKLKADKEFDEHTRINTTDTKTVLARIKKVQEYLLR
jgi:uncharacterized protein with ParB-like and HNH nuclease domain